MTSTPTLAGALGVAALAASLAAACGPAPPRDEPPVRARAADRPSRAPAPREAPAVRARLEHRPDEPDDDVVPCPPPGGLEVPPDLPPSAAPGPAAGDGPAPTRPATRG